MVDLNLHEDIGYDDLRVNCAVRLDRIVSVAKLLELL